MPRRFSLLLCPGLGADEELFEPILAFFHRNSVNFDATFLENLPMFDRNEPFASYAKRVIDGAGVTGRSFDLIVGFSLGGIVAQEGLVQNLITTKLLALISSPFSGEQIASPFRSIASWLASVPALFRVPVRNMIAFLYPVFRRKNKNAKQFAAMFRRSSVPLFFNAPYAISRWEGRLLRMRPRVLILQFAGMSDPLFSFRKIVRSRIPDFCFYRGNHIFFIDHYDFIAAELLRSIQKKSTL